MTRLLAVFTGLAALVFLSLFFLRDIASLPEPASAAVTAGQSDSRLQLQLSSRLAIPPVQASVPVADNWAGKVVGATRSVLAPFSQLDNRRSRPLIYLLGASLIGLLLGLVTRRPVPALADAAVANIATTEQTALITELRAELEERNDAIHDLEKVMEKRASAMTETLSMPLQEQLGHQEQTIRIITEDLTARDARIATQSAELEEKTHRLRELEDEIAGLGEREQPLERRIGESAQVITELEQELSTRRGEVIALQEELATARNRCDTLESQRTGLREQLSAITSEASTRETDLEESQSNLANRDAELANWKDSVGSLENEIEHRTETIERLEEDLAVREKQLATLRIERDGLSDTLTILQTRLDDRQSEFETEKQSLQLRIDELESELDRRTAQFGFLDDKQGERDAILEEMRREIESDQQQIIGLETELVDLQSQKEKMRAWESTLQTYKSDLRARDDIIDSLRNDVACLADTEQQVLDQRETIGELETELDKQTVLAQALKRGVDTLREFKELAEQREEDIDRLTGELQKTQTELDEWRSRIPPLEQKLQQRDNDIERLEQDNQTSTREMEELEQELADWRVKMTAMESELRERDAGLDDLREELESSHNRLLELGALGPQLEQARTELATAKQQFDLEVQARESLESELAELKAVEEKLAAWDSTVTTLRGDLRESQRALDAVLDDVGTLVGGRISVVGCAAAVNDVKSKLDERERETAMLRSQVERLEPQSAEAETLRHQLEERERESTTLRAEVERLEPQSAEAETLRHQLDERERESATLRAEVDRLELQSADTETLRHQLDEHRADLEAMRGELERTQGAVLRADEAEITLERNRETIARLEKDIRNKTESLDDLELHVADWIDKHATLNSNYESQSHALSELKIEVSQLQEKFEAQRATILKMRADKLSKDDVDELPTLTTVIRPGERPAKG